MKWKRSAPVKVEVEGYDPEYVRVLTRGEAREVLSEKYSGEKFAPALVAMALCDEQGTPRYEDIEAGMAEVDGGMEHPLFEAVARAAQAATFPKRKTDEGKAEAIPGDGST